MAVANFSNQTDNGTSQDPADSESQSSSTTLQTFLIIFKLTIGIGGIVGNLLVCIITRQMKADKVKFLIATQAAIDLFTSIILVADVGARDFKQIQQPPAGRLVIGYLQCGLWNGQLLLFGLFGASTYNLVAISIERYIAVFHPFWYRLNFTQWKTYQLGIAAWVLGPAAQIAYCYRGLRYDTITGKCGWIYPTLTVQQIIGVVLFLWDFFIPCLIMGFCFLRISIKLRSYDKAQAALGGNIGKEVTTISETVESSGNNMDTHAKFVTGGKLPTESAKEVAAEESRSRRVTKTFIFVFLAYLCCWSTNQVLFLQNNLGGYYHWGKPENHFANSMATLNTLINPFIYVLHLKHYRHSIIGFCKKINVALNLRTWT